MLLIINLEGPSTETAKQEPGAGVEAGAEAEAEAEAESAA
jgi:hypothetical protein